MSDHHPHCQTIPCNVRPSLPDPVLPDHLLHCQTFTARPCPVRPSPALSDHDHLLQCQTISCTVKPSLLPFASVTYTRWLRDARHNICFLTLSQSRYSAQRRAQTEWQRWILACLIVIMSNVHSVAKVMSGRNAGLHSPPPPPNRWPLPVQAKPGARHSRHSRQKPSLCGQTQLPEAIALWPDTADTAAARIKPSLCGQTQQTQPPGLSKSLCGQTQLPEAIALWPDTADTAARIKPSLCGQTQQTQPPELSHRFVARHSCQKLSLCGQIIISCDNMAAALSK